MTPYQSTPLNHTELHDNMSSRLPHLLHTNVNDSHHNVSLSHVISGDPVQRNTLLPGGNTTSITVEEYLTSVNERFTELVLPAIIVFGVLMVIGAIGNIFVLYVYTCKMKSGTITRFIQALAVFDLLSCCVAIPGEIIDMRNNYTFGKDPLCKIVRTVNLFCTVASGGTLVVVAIDRYKRICCPLRRQIAPQGALIILCCCTVASVIISLPTAALYGSRTVLTNSPAVNGTDCSINDHFIDTVFPLAYNSLQMMLFIVGAVTLVVLYTLIARRIFQHANQRQQRRGSVSIGRMKFASCSLSCGTSPTPTTENAFPMLPDHHSLINSLETKSCQASTRPTVAGQNQPLDQSNEINNPIIMRKCRHCDGNTNSKQRTLKNHETGKGLSINLKKSPDVSLTKHGAKSAKNITVFIEKSEECRKKKASCCSVCHDNKVSSLTSTGVDKKSSDKLSGHEGTRPSSIAADSEATVHSMDVEKCSLAVLKTVNSGNDMSTHAILQSVAPSFATEASSPQSDKDYDILNANFSVTHSCASKTDSRKSKSHHSITTTDNSIVSPSPDLFTYELNQSARQDQMHASQCGHQVNDSNLQTCSTTAAANRDLSHKHFDNDLTFSDEPAERNLAKNGLVSQASKKSSLKIFPLRERQHDESQRPRGAANTLSMRKRNSSTDLRGHSLTLQSMPRCQKNLFANSSVLEQEDLSKLSNRRSRNKQREKHRNEEAKISLQRRASLRGFAELRKLAFHPDSTGTRRMTLMLFLITLVYVLSFLPHLVLMTIKALDENSLSGYGGTWELVHNILIRSYFINSVANPIIYSFFSRNFLGQCRSSVCCKCSKSRG